MGSLDTYRAGIWAERLAALWLFFHGYRIIKCRFKTPVGEIDVIAKRGKTLVFVEVKRRAHMDAALEALRPQNAARVRRAAQWWLGQYPNFADKSDIRFDVVAVAPYARIRHVLDAF